MLQSRRPETFRPDTNVTNMKAGTLSACVAVIDKQKFLAPPPFLAPNPSQPSSPPGPQRFLSAKLPKYASQALTVAAL